MSLEGDLVTHIKASAINANISGRIYPQQAPQKASLPYIVVTRVATDAVQVLSEKSTQDFTLYQIDIIADDYVEVRGLAESLRDILDSSSPGDIKWIRFESDNDAYDPETEFPRVIQEYRISYTNS